MMDELIDPAKTHEALKAIRDDPRTGIIAATVKDDWTEITLRAVTAKHWKAIADAFGITADDKLLRLDINPDHVDATHATWRGGFIPDTDDPTRVQQHTVRHDYAHEGAKGPASDGQPQSEG